MLCLLSQRREDLDSLEHVHQILGNCVPFLVVPPQGSAHIFGGNMRKEPMSVGGRANGLLDGVLA